MKPLNERNFIPGVGLAAGACRCYDPRLDSPAWRKPQLPSGAGPVNYRLKPLALIDKAGTIKGHITRKSW